MFQMLMGVALAVLGIVAVPAASAAVSPDVYRGFGPGADLHGTGFYDGIICHNDPVNNYDLLGLTEQEYNDYLASLEPKNAKAIRSYFYLFHDGVAEPSSIAANAPANAIAAATHFHNPYNVGWGGLPGDNATKYVMLGRHGLSATDKVEGSPYLVALVNHGQSLQSQNSYGFGGYSDEFGGHYSFCLSCHGSDPASQLKGGRASYTVNSNWGYFGYVFAQDVGLAFVPFAKPLTATSSARVAARTTPSLYNQYLPSLNRTGALYPANPVPVVSPISGAHLMEYETGDLARIALGARRQLASEGIDISRIKNIAVAEVLEENGTFVYYWESNANPGLHAELRLLSVRAEDIPQITRFYSEMDYCTWSFSYGRGGCATGVRNLLGSDADMFYSFPYHSNKGSSIHVDRAMREIDAAVLRFEP